VQSSRTRQGEGRVARGLTQASLARKAQVSQITVKRAWRGQGRPSPGILARLAEALGVAPADLDPLRGKGA
jgi:transcriptional regulator with XRE-family HTH domain